jgi:hypothetical protein
MFNVEYRLTLLFNRIYYQHNPERLSTCPLTIHALLHIADSIEALGPVWCYWAFPMERYCGKLSPAIRSHRFPFASLDRYIVEEAQLAQIKSIYDLTETLSLKQPRRLIPGTFSHPSCMSQTTLSVVIDTNLFYETRSVLHTASPIQEKRMAFRISSQQYLCCIENSVTDF